MRLFVGGFVLESSGRPHGELQSKARRAIHCNVRNQGLERGGAGEIFRLDDVERPEAYRRRQCEPASHVALSLAISRVEIGAARDRAPLAQCRIAEFGSRLDEHEGWRRGQIVRRQLVDQVGGEVGELMLELELNSGGQKRGALKQSADHRIEIVLEQSAQALRHARIFLGEFGRLFTKYC